ncbi:MAG: M15 family metallopeptidase [Spirochaetes bacterium]|jgi:peptidoglycan L-alanyl-D-glutamate endopeptidase CwlK|nr:M15 family metallopeptidase [Spirochaetota bacterium]
MKLNIKNITLIISLPVILLTFFLYLNNQAHSSQKKKPSQTKREADHPLIPAYPDTIVSVTDNRVNFKNGTELIYDDGKIKSFKDMLKNSDIHDMFYQNYPAGKLRKPATNEDPGRFRSKEFFNAMYGDSQDAIERKLTTITWMPGISDTKLRVTTVNDVHKNLLRISQKLSNLPSHYHRFVDKPAGTFVYRKIAGTNRLSTHSFGIAIDINLNVSNYWRWDSDPVADDIRYQNRIPEEIVNIFESEGFIWGGRWYHYDTMHFEYRPELLIQN